jgi:hypothetical protein
MPVCSVLIKVHIGWLGVFSQQVGLVLAPGKALRKMMIGIFRLVHVPGSATFLSNTLFLFLTFKTSYCALGEDRTNVGHRAWNGL